ncbi:MAG: L-threonylcarbamoyladenylate synthase [bacterium]|nr:L-threonylcarbamoyladenylate synthase [Candidatus Sumerlaeota bacterium]
MITKLVQIDPQSPDPEILGRAAEILRAGGLVAFPTETVYGLGANAYDDIAVRRIFAAKGRPASNPLIVHLCSADAAPEVAGNWPPAARRLAERFWPGPLTLVVERGARVPDTVTAGGPTVALRVPAHAVALALIRAVGAPIAAPSANRSTRISPTRAEHVMRSLRGRIDMVLDAGRAPGGIESTVIDLSSDPPRLLRPGLIAPAEIEKILCARLDYPVHTTTPRGGCENVFRSPGMMKRHYAPQTLMECHDQSAGQRALTLAAEGLRVAWLALDTDSSVVSTPNLTTIVMPSTPKAYASRLYATLHRIDNKGYERIIVTLPPSADEWLAVRDRLHRASAKMS